MIIIKRFNLNVVRKLHLVENKIKVSDFKNTFFDKFRHLLRANDWDEELEDQESKTAFKCGKLSYPSWTKFSQEKLRQRTECPICGVGR